jgi:hypothetical protein
MRVLTVFAGMVRGKRRPVEPLAGEPRQRQYEVPVARRVGTWLCWWVLLMSFWVMLDDSTLPDELLAGAGAAVLGALLAEQATYQAATRFRMRFEWLAHALSLPGQVVADTVTVFGALGRKLIRGENPPSEFAELPTQFGDDSPHGVTRRVLLIGGRSVAPNMFTLGIDKDTNLMVVHRLVGDKGHRGD